MTKKKKQKHLHLEMERFLGPNFLSPKSNKTYCVLRASGGALLSFPVQKSVSKVLKTWYFPSKVESRIQGLRPRSRTQKKSEAKAKDSLSEDRTARGQGQECSRPRTMDTIANVLQRKRSSKKFLRRSPIYRCTQNF